MKVWEEIEGVLATSGLGWMTGGEISRAVRELNPARSDATVRATVGFYCVNDRSKNSSAGLVYRSTPLLINDDAHARGKRYRLLTEPERQSFIASPRDDLELLDYSETVAWLSGARAGETRPSEGMSSSGQAAELVVDPKASSIQAPAPAASIFVNEDLSKGENRTNLALMAVLMIPQFRYWLLGRLGFPPSCTIFPPQSVGGLRPDFVAVTPDGEVHGWIEVELGGENAAQMANYRDVLAPHPVKCIAGSADQGHDLSLEELAFHLAEGLQDQLDLQQRRNVQMFIDLVAQLRSTGEPATYVTPGDTVRDNGFIMALRAAIGDRLTFGSPPLRPGELQVSTISQKGWTLRAYCKGPTESSVALLWNPALGRGVIRVPASEKLAAYFGPQLAAGYATFWLDRLGLDISVLSYAQSLAVQEDALSELIPEFSAAMMAFAS